MSSRKSVDHLQDYYSEQDNLPALKKVAERYAVSVTDAVLGAIKSADDPVGLQYLPQAKELVTQPEEIADPIGDSAHSPVPGIVHRYPDRVLLMPVHTCAVYCRFCFRREAVGPGKKTMSAAELEKALDYIRNDANIYEVILSGGDPLILSPRRLKAIFDQLEAIPHVQVIRIHSRLPVADPGRITDELCAALQTRKAMYVAIHVNHAQEITPEAEAAFTRLRRADCVLLSQSVLLRGVNDNPQALEGLFRRLVALRVKPYYLHHPDLAPGTSHFRLPLKQGQSLVRALRGKMSGLCQPVYMLDIPGGHGKVPVGPQYLTEADGRTEVTDPNGCAHSYPDEQG
ncbi:MAG TPA: lysine-2,3-aminomutase-like protein [Patescibacteria group bacterium]|nr:lysine-2,3-aminomutase-like protein [Patescibacteria group bacterium]